MDYLKLSLVILLSFEFLCLVSSNPITSLFGKSDDKAEAEDKTAVSTASTAKSGAAETTTPGPSSSCGGLKGFLHICDKTATEPPKSVKTRSVSEESDSDSDSDESKSDEDKKSSDVTVTVSSSGDKASTEGKIEKRQAEDSETSESPESEDTPAAPEIPAPEDLPLGLKKRQVEESENSSESESEEEEFKRKRRECRDGPEDVWKDCKKWLDKLSENSENKTSRRR